MIAEKWFTLKRDLGNMVKGLGLRRVGTLLIEDNEYQQMYFHKRNLTGQWAAKMRYPTK